MTISDRLAARRITASPPGAAVFLAGDGGSSAKAKPHNKQASVKDLPRKTMVLIYCRLSKLFGVPVYQNGRAMAPAKKLMARGFSPGLAKLTKCKHNAPSVAARERNMHIIARPILREFSERHADARAWLEAWWKSVSKARWEVPKDVKAAYDSVDRIGECYVFNVCRNRYRLIVKIVFAYQRNDGTVFIKHVMTHADYDKGAWKEDC